MVEGVGLGAYDLGLSLWGSGCWCQGSDRRLGEFYSVGYPPCDLSMDAKCEALLCIRLDGLT